jgi:hypothetical protein
MAPSLWPGSLNLLYLLGTSLSTFTSATPIPPYNDFSVIRLASRTTNFFPRQETTPTAAVVVVTIYPTPTPSQTPTPSPSPTGSSDKLYWTSTHEHPFSIPMLIGLTIAIFLFGWACRYISKRRHRGDDLYKPSQEMMNQCWREHGQGNVLRWEKRGYKMRVIKRPYKPEEDAMGLQQGEWIGGSYGTGKEMNGLWQQYGERPYVYEGDNNGGGGG